MRFVSPLVLIALMASPHVAHASDVAVTAPTTSEGVPPGLSHAVGQLAREIIGGLDDTTVVGASDVRLADLQLARGCMGETPECLTSVAEDLEADLLVMPSIDRAAGTFVLSIVAFRVSSGGIARAVRRGDEETLMDGLEAQVREVLGLPPLPAEPDEVDVSDETPDEGSDQSSDPGQPVVATSSGSGPLPWILASVGLVTVGVGVGLGAASSGAQSEYENTVVTTPSDADAARDAYERGATFALTANVLFAVGGAIAAAGLIWLIIDVATADAPVQVAPAASADAFGFVAMGAL